MSLAGGCAGKKERKPRPDLKEQAKRLAREQAPTATLRVTGGRFRVEDTAGRPVIVFRIRGADALVQPADPSRGPLTLNQADCTLYREGKPSLWLKAPVARWQDGTLTAERGARSGTIDGRMALQGQTATWTAKTDLLAVAAARAEIREPGRPSMRAEGPVATWQNGLLTLPTGAAGRAADGSASFRADQLRWRAATHSLDATGRVRMTSGRIAGGAERLTSDTVLRRYRLTGGRPHITITPAPAPVVSIAAGKGYPMTSTRSRLPLAGVAAAAGLLPVSQATAARVTLPSGIRIEARKIEGNLTRSEATGSVVLTRGSDELRADRVVVTLKKVSSSASIQEVQATGGVHIVSRPKADEGMDATGAAATYWPGTRKAALTGGVTVKMTSPQLEEPASLTGARADIDLAKRTVEVFRTEAAPVVLRLQPRQAKAPVRLDADRAVFDGSAPRITATGSPVLTAETGTVRADRIWFDIDPKASAVRTIHAAGRVRIDNQDPEQGRFQATAQEATLDQAASTVVLTGNVAVTNLRPGETEPTRLENTDELTYNLKTGAFRAGAVGDAERKVRATFKPKPKTPGSSPQKAQQ